MTSPQSFPNLLALQPTLPVESPPKYRNTELEKRIAEKKDNSCLDLESLRLTDQDMEIVAYYALRSNKVSDFP